MLRLVATEEPPIRWIQKQLPYLDDFGPSMTLCVMDGSKLIAVAVYNYYVGYDCQLTFISESPKWAARGIITGILSLPFEGMGCKRITTITDVGNIKAIAVNEKLGFRCEGRMRKASPSGNGNDAVIYGLLKEDFEAGKWARKHLNRQTPQA